MDEIELEDYFAGIEERYCRGYAELIAELEQGSAEMMAEADTLADAGMPF